MQSHDLSCEPSVDNPNPPDLLTMFDQPSTASSPCDDPHQKDSRNVYTDETKSNHSKNNNNRENHIVRKERPLRACTARAAARLYAATAAEAAQRKQKSSKKERPPEDLESPPLQQQCGKIVTPLMNPPPSSQLPRWSIRSMWELASILNFLNTFRPLLNINVEFSAEEFETALITPNNTLGDIHIPLLKAIPPITRMPLGHNTWVTVLCRKLRDWWHWVADGELPVVASRGAEVEAYNALDPGVRVVILKALCDIRVEQEDIRNYIDSSIKHGFQLSAFQKEQIGGDSHGISYWYEDDPIIGHRLYREIRKVEVKKGKGKSVQPTPNSSYQWETVATNLDEFQNVSEKLFSSKNRTEASLGKKLKNDMLPEIEKVHKKKERLLKKQHREAILLDNMINVDGLAPGRSLRDRKPVTYTFDDYDRSINEAIKITKWKQPSPEPTVRRELVTKPDTATNGRWDGPSQTPELVSFEAPSPMSPDIDGADEVRELEPLDRSNRQRQRPQRYSVKEFVEVVSDNEADFESDDDIVGEVVYDEEYLRRRKQRKKISSSSEGDEEFHLDEENTEDDDDEEEDSLSVSEDSDEPQRFKKLPSHSRRDTKLRSVDELQSGLRRSRRAAKNHVNYRQYELSDSETESMKSEKLNASYENTEASNSADFSVGSEDSDENDDNLQMRIDEPVEEHHETVERQHQPPEKSNNPKQDEVEGVKERRFIDLNELAPGSGFDESPNTTVKDEDANNF